MFYVLLCTIKRMKMNTIEYSKLFKFLCLFLYLKFIH